MEKLSNTNEKKMLSSPSFLKTQLCLLLMCLLAAGNGCRTEDGPNPNGIVQFPDTFEISFHEEIDSLTRSLVLDVNTLRYYECKNYSIATEKDYQDGVLEISLKDVLPPADCVSGNAQARDTISLGYLIFGEQPIRFQIKSVIENNGVLEVTPERYTLSMDTENGLQIKRYELMRLPENLIWGFISYQNSQATQLNNFFDDLNAITSPANLLDGDYAYFQWQQGEPVDNLPPNEPADNDYITKVFVRESSPANNAALQDLIDAYTAQGLLIEFYSGWKGLW